MLSFLQKSKKIELVSPVTGKTFPLNKVKDPAFATGAMGSGIGIIPHDNVVFAPCDGEIIMLFPTLHAFGIRLKDGCEILVHIGIDTVNLQGRNFKQLVSSKNVKSGDPVIFADFSEIKKLGYDTSVVLLITKNSKNNVWKFHENNSVIAPTDVIAECGEKERKV